MILGKHFVHLIRENGTGPVKFAVHGIIAKQVTTDYFLCAFLMGPLRSHERLASLAEIACWSLFDDQATAFTFINSFRNEPVTTEQAMNGTDVSQPSTSMDDPDVGDLPGDKPLATLKKPS